MLVLQEDTGATKEGDRDCVAHCVVVERDTDGEAEGLWLVLLVLLVLLGSLVLLVLLV